MIWKVFFNIYIFYREVIERERVLTVLKEGEGDVVLDAHKVKSHFSLKEKQNDSHTHKSSAEKKFYR